MERCKVLPIINAMADAREVIPGCDVQLLPPLSRSSCATGNLDDKGHRIQKTVATPINA